eukprot:scaffold3315_cov78-Isochrysis_galbana.AAC.1
MGKRAVYGGEEGFPPPKEGYRPGGREGFPPLEADTGRGGMGKEHRQERIRMEGVDGNGEGGSRACPPAGLGVNGSSP